MKQPRGAAGTDLLFFVFFIIVLGVVWALTGGPARDISRSGPFLNLPFPLGRSTTTTPYDIPGVKLPTGGDISGGAYVANIPPAERSPYAGTVTLSAGSASIQDPSRQYVILKTLGVQGQITISGWRLVSSSGAVVSIGPATLIPRAGDVNTGSPVAVGSNTTIYVTTGRSPVGISFRENMCSGYFAGTQTFNPPLARQCPDPSAELARVRASGVVMNDACTKYVDSLSQCQVVVTNVPADTGGACQNFVTTSLTYNGCVDLHRGDATFFKNTWRIYLERNASLWKQNNEDIRLLDENGKTVARVTY